MFSCLAAAADVGITGPVIKANSELLWLVCRTCIVVLGEICPIWEVTLSPFGPQEKLSCNTSVCVCHK